MREAVPATVLTPSRRKLLGRVDIGYGFTLTSRDLTCRADRAERLPFLPSGRRREAQERRGNLRLHYYPHNNVFVCARELSVGRARGGGGVELGCEELRFGSDLNSV